MSELVAGWRVWPSYGERGDIVKWNAQRRRSVRWPAYDYVSAASRDELLERISG